MSYERVRKAPRCARPCTCCGKPPKLIERTGRDLERFRIGPARTFHLECCPCRVFGERHTTIRAAVRAWGVRTPPPKPKASVVPITRKRAA